MRTPSTLYHFCSGPHLLGINKGGIAKGVIPFRMLDNGHPTLLRGYQWLTRDHEWDQSWADAWLNRKLPFRKNEYRLTIDIPHFAMHQVISWPEFAVKFNPPSREFLSSFRGHQHWYLFRGPIPVSWISETVRNPIPINLPEPHESP